MWAGSRQSIVNAIRLQRRRGNGGVAGRWKGPDPGLWRRVKRTPRQQYDNGLFNSAATELEAPAGGALLCRIGGAACRRVLWKVVDAGLKSCPRHHRPAEGGSCHYVSTLDEAVSKGSNSAKLARSSPIRRRPAASSSSRPTRSRHPTRQRCEMRSSRHFDAPQWHCAVRDFRPCRDAAQQVPVLGLASAGWHRTC
jgi:hypothetical protein